MTGYRQTLVLYILLSLLIPCMATAQETDSSSIISDFQWITHGSGNTQITTGAQFSHGRWYTELTMGGFSAHGNREDAFFLGLNLGHRFPINSWLFLGADLGLRNVIPGGSDNPIINTGKYLTLDGRLRIEAVLGRNMSIFIGAASTNIYTDNSFNSVDTREESIFWGVGLL